MADRLTINITQATTSQAWIILYIVSDAKNMPYKIIQPIYRLALVLNRASPAPVKVSFT